MNVLNCTVRMRKPNHTRARTILSTILAGLLTAPVALSAHAAAAQSMASAPNAQHPTTYCNASTLTGAKFMQIIRTVMAHGDLTDIAFIEKTLNAKFTITNDPPFPTYQTDEMLGSPIPVTLYTHWSEASPPEKGWVSKIFFQTRGINPANKNFLKDCLHIPLSDFFAAFKGQYAPEVPVGPIPVPGPSDPIDVTAMQTEEKPGKNGSQLQLNLEYMAPDEDVFAKSSLIYGVAIVQFP